MTPIQKRNAKLAKVVRMLGFFNSTNSAGKGKRQCTLPIARKRLCVAGAFAES